MGRRRRASAYRTWLREHPALSLDRPDGSLRTLFLLEAVATLLVVGMILTAVALVAGQRRGTPLGSAPSVMVAPPFGAPPQGMSAPPGGGGATLGAAGVTTATPAGTARASGAAGAPAQRRPGTGVTATGVVHRPPAPQPPGPYCLHVTHRLNTQWPGGLQAQYTVANCGTATVSSWAVSVSFSGTVSIQAWNAGAGTGSTRVDFTSVYYDSTVVPGASVTFGFNATWSGGAARTITGCAVTSGTCS